MINIEKAHSRSEPEVIALRSRFSLRSICSKSQSAAGRLERRFAPDSGSALVEMAIVLPLMLLIMTGIASFSMALYQKLLLTEAVSSAGRVLAAEQGQSDPCADTWTALTKSAPGLSSSSLSMTIVWTPASTGKSNTYTTNTCTAMGSASTGVKSGDYAQVFASYPCVLQVVNIWGKGPGFSSCTVAAGVAEDIQ